MAFGVGTGDWGDDMPFMSHLDEVNPDVVYCLGCDAEMEEFYTTFFRDEEGKKRYGSICEDCKAKSDVSNKN